MLLFLLQLHIWNLSRTITSAWNKSCSVKFSMQQWKKRALEMQCHSINKVIDCSDIQTWMIKTDTRWTQQKKHHQQQQRRRRQKREKKQKPFAMQSFRFKIIRYLEIVFVCRCCSSMFFSIFRRKKNPNDWKTSVR